MLQSPGAIALELGPLIIRWYGVIIAAGILVAYSLAVKELRRRGADTKTFEDMAVWVILAGVIGARLYYVFFNAGYYLENPVQILQIWRGGLAIHGAIIGGALAYTFFAWKKNIPWFLYADALMPGVLLAQGIGRWGNFFNSEAFGAPTDLPWKLFIPEENRPDSFADFEYYHPTFLYESLWNVAGFFFLMWLSRKTQSRRGAVFFAYLLWYSVGRFFIESIRMDSFWVGGFRVAQVASGVLFLVGIFGLVFLLKRGRLKISGIT